MKLYTLEVFSCYTGYEHLISKLPAIFNYLLHKGRTNAGMLYIGTQIYGGFESFGVWILTECSECMVITQKA